jgi:hypothetical protein
MATRRIASLSSRKVIYAAMLGNLLVAATKFGAAAWTGSSAMLSEGVHSVVDTGNSLLLLYGHRAERSPDHNHPLGYGREIYFWSFVVAVMVFALGVSNRFQPRPPFACKDDPAAVCECFASDGAETGGAEPHIAEQSRSWRAASGEQEVMRGS